MTYFNETVLSERHLLDIGQKMLLTDRPWNPKHIYQEIVGYGKARHRGNLSFHISIAYIFTYILCLPICQSIHSSIYSIYIVVVTLLFCKITLIKLSMNLSILFYDVGNENSLSLRLTGQDVCHLSLRCVS